MKRLILALFILASISSFTQSNKALQKRIDSLELRISKLENMISPGVATTPIKAEEEIKPHFVKANWRKLYIGMSLDAVRDLFGDPSNISQSEYSINWRYGYSSIWFDYNTKRITSWSE
ncbi:MAG: hypothetical protein AUJ54_02970 [Ignavibacteria bacterium CG1_02_37_35]|nr:MAG: hypothetical protein AUJ54_02970 [Ignavibacteria bacterium CG1_02_37_35]